MKRRTFLMIGTGAVVGGALAACGGSDAPAVLPPPDPAPVKTAAVLAWNAAALQAVRVTKPGPPMVARSLAVLHTVIYDAWAAYDRSALGTQLGAGLRRPASEHSAQNKLEAISYAAHAALVDQFPTQKAAFDAQLAALGFDPNGAAPAAGSPRATAAAAAAALLEACHRDGSNQLGTLTPGGVPYADYTAYVPANPPMLVASPTPAGAIPQPGRWQPLTYADASGALKTPGFVGACWERVAPFALSSPGQLRPGPPAAPGTPEYVAQAQQVLDITAGLTEQQKVIAEYWADGPNSELPPGHWCLFAQFVSRRDGQDDDADVKLFFALANALSDAAIAAWDAKRTYDSERPITAIRYLMLGQTVMGFGAGGPAAGPQPIAGEAWIPFQPSTFPTPPFPEFVSGHSTFSAAAAEVLARFTGSDRFGASYTKPARSMQIAPSLPTGDLTLSWSSFSEAAAEAGISRVYGGIHFDPANQAGQAIGRQVGAAVFDKARGLWEGRG